MSVWDDPDLKSGGEYIKFENAGDTVSGVVSAVRVRTWDNGARDPEVLLVVNGEERSMTAGQVMLKKRLAELRPEAGDTLTVTLTEIEKRAGGKTLKHFDVQVVRGNGVVAAPVAAPSSPPMAATTYSSEQVAAAKLLGIDLPVEAPF